jgi:predicted transcriptional regulator
VISGTAKPDHTDSELAIIAGIERALDDMKAGRTIPHEEAKRRIRAVIVAAEKRTRE